MNPKLEQLASLEGFDNPMQMLEAHAFDSVVMGICTNADCDYTTDVEPDNGKGYCEMCQTQTVASCLRLGGII